jgi:ribosomal RNA assembly protein
VLSILEAVLVPQERVRIIKDKKAQSKIKKALKVKLKFQENSVLIEGEGLELYQAKTIIKAIGRGFSPENAFRLLKEDEVLEVIELNRFNENKLKIVKSRLIGTNGKTWKMIENFSGCVMSVYGKTVSIIGTYEQLNIAREAVQMIIRGSKHYKVYNFLHQAGL